MRVVIVDDHPAVLDAISTAVNSESGLAVCGTARNIADAKKVIRSEQPEIVTVDFMLGQEDGLDLLRYLQQHHPDVRPIVVSIYEDYDYAELAYHAGAWGYVMKSQPVDALVHALRTVADGQVYLSHVLAANILSRTAITPEPSRQVDDNPGGTEVTPRDVDTHTKGTPDDGGESASMPPSAPDAGAA